MIEIKPTVFPYKIFLSICVLAGWHGVSAQCVQNSLHSTSYGQASCGQHVFQYATGTGLTGHNTCGGLQFSSPLTDGDQTTSFNEFIEDESVYWSPNPVAETLQLHGGLLSAGHCQLITPDGALRYSKSFSSGENALIDVSALPSGCYLLVTRFDTGQRFIHRIIKTN